ncbi:MAG: DNA cytosine methyltransferase [Bauldia sp.]|nr:DNA cytosine methyltransferase [Bauldia sp.]
MKASVVDLFCGIGGLSFGLRQAGLSVAGGIDLDASCKFAYEENVKATFVADDMRDVTRQHVEALFERKAHDYRVLVGCAPCAPFSFYTGRYRKAKKSDPKWSLLDEFLRLALETRPDVISMENVPRVVLSDVFASFVKGLSDDGYHVTYRKVRAVHFGVPQRRSRLVLFASRFGEIHLGPPTHPRTVRTVRDAIGHLPALVAGVPSAHDRLHVTRGLGPRNLARLQATAEGGSWREWDQALQLDCHKRPGGMSFRSVYGRMTWDEPSPVITTQCLGIGNGRFGHPDQDRAISIREAALLQSFPADFALVSPEEPVNGLRLARQIGNAVPVSLARAIGRAVKKHLSDVSMTASAGRSARE